MRRTAVIVASLGLTGCFASVRNVSGRVYEGEFNALEQAIRDSGSTNLQCDPSEVRVREFVTGAHRSAETHLVAEGCGQRAFYVEDCSAYLAPAGPPGGARPTDATCAGNGTGLASSSCYQTPVRSVERICELLLVSKIKLD